MSAVRMNGGSPGAGIATMLESGPPFPAGVSLVRDRPVTPLNHSARLARMSMRGARLSHLYALDAFECIVADQRWRWRWRYFEGPLTGLELRLSIGGAETTMGIEDLSAFGAAADVARPELPDVLRAPLLTSLGEPAWPVIEAALGHAIEITAVRVNRALNLASECVTFEIGAAPDGPMTRGFLGPIDESLQRLLCELGERRGARSALSMNVPLEWAAVAGTTQLGASELRAIEIQDVVLIDDAVFNAEVLECQLAVGVNRQRAGRAALRLGELRMVQLTSPGAVIMSHSDTQPARAHDSAFDDVPVMLRFELGQWQAPLSEVAQLTPGAVIDLGQRIDGQSIAMWAGQRCIGRGQLVAIGERLGVRVLSLAAPERGAAPPAGERSASANVVPGG